MVCQQFRWNLGHIWLDLCCSVIKPPRCSFAVAAEELLVPVDFPAILVTTGMEKLIREVLSFAR